MDDGYPVAVRARAGGAGVRPGAPAGHRARRALPDRDQKSDRPVGLQWLELDPAAGAVPARPRPGPCAAARPGRLGASRRRARRTAGPDPRAGDPAGAQPLPGAGPAARRGRPRSALGPRPVRPAAPVQRLVVGVGHATPPLGDHRTEPVDRRVAGAGSGDARRGAAGRRQVRRRVPGADGTPSPGRNWPGASTPARSAWPPASCATCTPWSTPPRTRPGRPSLARTSRHRNSRG